MQELDEPDEPIEVFSRVLSEDEWQRSSRFLRQQSAQRFTVARGFLRRTLGAVSGTAPKAIRFRYAAHGKPSLDASKQRGPALQFNLAHSDHLAMLAVTVDDPVGVDIERIRPVRSRDGIVAKHFSAVEREAFERLPTQEHAAAFFRVWTRKEAIVKALGTGLTLSLTSFDVAIDDQTQAGLLAIRHADHAASQWSLVSLTAPAGFCAAVAVARQGPLRVERYGTAEFPL